MRQHAVESASGSGAASAAWSEGGNDSFIANGAAGSTTFAYSGQSSYTYAFSGRETLTFAETSTDSASLTQAGSYSNGILAISQVVRAHAASDLVTLSDASAVSFSGGAYLSMSLSGSTALAGTFGYINGGGTAAGTVSETDQFTYASITTETLSVSASNSWSSYESGTFGNGSYSFASVLYQESASLSFTDDVAARQTLTGGGAMTAALSGPGQGVVAYNGLLATAVNSVSYSSFDSYSFSSYESYTSLVHIGGTSSLYEAGAFANGSYSFGSVVLSDSGNHSYSYAGTSRETFAGNGYESVAATGSRFTTRCR